MVKSPQFRLGSQDLYLFCTIFIMSYPWHLVYRLQRLPYYVAFKSNFFAVENVYFRHIFYRIFWVYEVNRMDPIWIVLYSTSKVLCFQLLLVFSWRCRCTRRTRVRGKRSSWLRTRGFVWTWPTSIVSWRLRISPSTAWGEFWINETLMA